MASPETSPMPTTSPHARGLRLTIALASLAGAACNRDKLLEVQTPDIITTSSAGSVSGAQAVRAAAVGNFLWLYAGDNNGSSPLGMNLATGMFADEIFSARSGTEHWDQRAINSTLLPSSTWNQVGNTHTQLIRAIKAINQYPPAGTTKGTQLGELYTYRGYTYLLTAEAYCNGVPFTNGDDANPTYTVLSNADLYTRALAVFDSAAQNLATDTTAANAAQIASLSRTIAVGRGRVLLNMVRDSTDVAGFQAAAAAVTAVPTTFSFNLTYSSLTASIVNVVYDWMVATRNFGASDKEGGNGLDFLSSKDPRIKVDPTKTAPGQDGNPTPTLLFNNTTNFPVPLATGTEARLIEAEAKLASGDAAGWLAALNTLRTGTTGLAPLADPGTAAARNSLMFRERAFWMYMTSHRLGDLRRLVRQYGRNSETVYPTGAYFKGGVYGTDVNLVPSQAEQNNPSWKACTDRKA